jgi:LemA protein
MLIPLIIAAAVLLLIIVGMYNRLIRRRNEVENAFGGMDVQLKNRYDLIPNLVATVKQYATHEKDLLEKVTELRAKATNAQLSADEKVQIDNHISSSMRGIMVAVENYPDLKANENFIHLQRSLNEVESQISASRRTYNAVVTDYNNAIQTFPSNIMASIMGFKAKHVFVIQEAERENVNIKNLFN